MVNDAIHEKSNTSPPVTFALISYNQEKYIKKAIEGVFSQTYQQMEIIISDDCSTDRTYEIIEEMAKEYTGGKKLTILKNNTNMGTLGHLIKIGRIASGKYIVVAAGDDVSLPNRTQKLVDSMGPNTWAISGSYFAVGPNGEFISIKMHKKEDFTRKLGDSSWIHIHGGTACYRKEIFSLAPMPNKPILLEDYCLAILLHRLNRDVSVIEEPLVLHRIHESNTGIKENFKRNLTHQRMELNAQRMFKLRGEAIAYLLSSNHFTHNERDPLKATLIRLLNYTKLKENWIEGGAKTRILILLHSIRWRDHRFAILRIFGLKSYLKYTSLISPKKLEKFDGRDH